MKISLFVEKGWEVVVRDSLNNIEKDSRIFHRKLIQQLAIYNYVEPRSETSIFAGDKEEFDNMPFLILNKPGFHLYVFRNLQNNVMWYVLHNYGRLVICCTQIYSHIEDSMKLSGTKPANYKHTLE